MPQHELDNEEYVPIWPIYPRMNLNITSLINPISQYNQQFKLV